MTSDDRLTYSFATCPTNTRCDLCGAWVHQGDICEMTYSKRNIAAPPIVICGQCMERNAEDTPPAVHRGCPVD